MAISFTLNAELRSDKGKGASRRLRRTGKVPGIMYGAGQEPLQLAFQHNELLNNLAHEAFYSHVLNVNVNGKTQQAILKDLQRHPAKPVILHLDLLRVSENEEIRVHVPLHFMGEKEAVGVKQQGGVVSHNMIEIEVACLPRHLPEYIEVDITTLEIGQAVHLSDLKLPEGVRIVQLAYGEEHDLPVVAIHHARVTVEETPETEEVEAEEEVPAAEPDADAKAAEEDKE